MKRMIPAAFIAERPSSPCVRDRQRDCLETIPALRPARSRPGKRPMDVCRRSRCRSLLVRHARPLGADRRPRAATTGAPTHARCTAGTGRASALQPCEPFLQRVGQTRLPKALSESAAVAGRRWGWRGEPLRPVKRSVAVVVLRESRGLSARRTCTVEGAQNAQSSRANAERIGAKAIYFRRSGRADLLSRLGHPYSVEGGRR